MVNIQLSDIDYMVLAVYIAVLLGIGFYLDKGKKKANADIFLGGRTLKWWQIGFSLFSANTGPTMLIGFASIGFSQGVVGSNFEWLAWVFLLLLAMFFLPRYLATKVRTIPQFLRLRFGDRSYYFLVIYSLISILVVWLGSALYAGGLIISQVFDSPLMWSVIITALIASSITAVGGLKAVVRTGIFQSVIILLSSTAITYFALKRIGGIDAFIGAVPADYWKLFRPASDPEYSWVAILAGYPVVAIYYWCADQTIVQKVLAAKDLKEGQHGIFFLAALKIIMPLIFVFPGMMCFVLFSETTQADNAYVVLVKGLMPQGLLGLCIAALVAALMDTVASGLNSFSTVFTLDVASRFSRMDEDTTRRIGRWITLLAAVLATIIAYLFSVSGKGFFELTQGLVSILAPPLSVVFLAGIFWKRVNRVAVETVLYGGGFICLLAGVCHVLNFPHHGFWPHFLLLSVYLFLGLAVLMVIVTFVSSQPAAPLPIVAGEQPEVGPAWPTWIRWMLLASVMGVIYTIFQ